MLIGVVAVAILIAAQGVGGAVRSLVTEGPTRLETVGTCLTERSVEYGDVQGDLLALHASAGALATAIEGNRVTVSIEDSDDGARRLYENYLQVGGAEITRRLELRRRVVLLWEQEPTASQREFMRLCTLDAQG